jgi:dipeptidyl aminopeptidase/acylaminoacyl peptidase
MKIYLSLLVLIFIYKIFPAVPDEILIEREGVKLKGEFYISASGDNSPTLILLQGFPGNETDVLGLCNIICRAGINVITFNYSGTFRSQGECNWENTQEDINAVFSFIHKSGIIKKYKLDTNKVYLAGYSYGGGMALTYAAQHPEIKKIISIAGNDHGAFMKEYIRNIELREMIDNIFEKLKAPDGPVRFAQGGTPNEISKMKINPIYDLVKMAPSLKEKDILIICGWDDEQVKIENNILPFYRALKKEDAKKVKMIAFQDNHSFRNSRTEVAQKIIDWIKAD